MPFEPLPRFKRESLVFAVGGARQGHGQPGSITFKNWSGLGAAILVRFHWAIGLDLLDDSSLSMPKKIRRSLAISWPLSKPCCIAPGPGSRQGYLGSDAHPIALRPCNSTAINGFFFSSLRRRYAGPLHRDDNVCKYIVIQVAKSCTAARPSLIENLSGIGRDVDKSISVPKRQGFWR